MSALTPILSSPGWELLESLQAKQATNPIPLPELGSALRASGLDAELVVAVLTQLALRQAARAKFGPLASSRQRASLLQPATPSASGTAARRASRTLAAASDRMPWQSPGWA